MNRRGFLMGLAAGIAAPAVIRIPGLLMPIKALVVGPSVQIYESDFGTIRFVTEEEIRAVMGIGIWREPDPDLMISHYSCETLAGWAA